MSIQNKKFGGLSAFSRFLEKIKELFVQKTDTASSTNKGISKLYTTTGNNTDGSITQKKVTEELSGKLPYSGGTLTGDIYTTPYYDSTISDPDGGQVTIISKGKNNKGTHPSTITEYHTLVSAVDKTGENSSTHKYGHVQTSISTTGNVTTEISAFKDTANANNSASISVSMNTSGDISTYAPTPVSSSNDTNIATTAFVKTEVRPSSDGQFAKKANTTAANIIALDTAAKNAITGLSASGTTVTYTKGDGTSSTITTQDTVYEHPTTAGNKHIPTGGSTGQILKYGGSSGTATWGTLSASDVGAAPSDIDTGVMSVTASSTNGKVSVDGTDVTVYTHPTTAGNKHIPSGGSSGQILKYSASGTATWANEYSYTHPTSGATAGDYGPSDNVTGTNNTTLSVPAITVDANGHITAIENKTYTSKDTVYEHPTTSGNKHIPSGGSSGKILKWSSDGTATWETEYSYSHPSTAGNKHIPSGGSTGQILKYGGSSGTASWGTLSASDVGAAPSDIDTGVMSVTASSTNGKVSVDGTDVTVYTHPTTAGNKHIPSGGSSGQILKYSAAGTAAWGTLSASDVGASPTNHTHTKSDITDFPTIPTITDTYSGTSSDGMSGKAVKSAIDSALVSAYKPSGSIAYASLPTLAANVMGNVYNVTDSFTIDNRFVEYDSSKTQTFPAGTEVAVINTGTSGSPTYKFSVMSGFIDLSGYQLANTAVTHTASTAAGSSKKPVYINSSGVATEISYTIEKSVPSNAVFTDTTYTGSDGVTLTGTNFTNSGVRAVSASSTNGKVKVNTNGTESDVTVYTHPTTAGNKHIPSGGSSGQILKYSAAGTATWANEYSYTHPNTEVTEDTYGPSADVTGTNNTTISIPYFTVNAQGHITAAGNKTYTSKDTVYTHPTSAGNKHVPVSVGSATQPVYSDSNGVLQACTYSLNKTVPSDAVFTDTNTKVTNTLGTNTKFYVTGTTSTTTNTGTQYFDTGVYVSETAGELVATKFTGPLNGNANTASKINTSAKIGDTNKPVYIAADGTVTAISYTIAKSVPSNAVFTDTVYTHPESGATAGSYGPSADVTGSNNATLSVPYITIDVNGHITSISNKTYTSKDTVYTHPNSGVTAASYGPSADASPAHGGTFSVPYITVNAAGHVTAASTKTITLPADNDTKNTAGSTDTSSKIFLIGATSQAANPQTYSDNEVYVTSGVLTTKSVQVGGTACTLQYNSTNKCVDFVFA